MGRIKNIFRELLNSCCMNPEGVFHGLRDAIVSVTNPVKVIVLVRSVLISTAIIFQSLLFVIVTNF